VSVRFEPAARRAIDRAMAEVERRGHRKLDALHLLVGVLTQPDATLAAALESLDVSPDILRAEASRRLREQPPTDTGDVQIGVGTERVLERAHRISAQRDARAVSDLDILVACAQDRDTPAGAILDEAGVTASRLWALYGAAGRPDDVAPARLGGAEGGSESEARISGYTRSGIGYDSHRFGIGGPLVLGGVSIPADIHLVGHSDGDAAAHAVTDAVLGAAAAGDIGEMFSDEDAENRGRDSMEILAAAAARVRASGLEVHQVDLTVIAETPKIAPHRASMRDALARALSIPPDRVSVKGKTNEGMGWIGRGEGLACIAVATLVPISAARDRAR
jgi:2-C-methyl-D-erythritol 2,4-cyclodiphosphate synthase